MKKNIFKLYNLFHITNSNPSNFFKYLFIATILGSILEVFGVGLILPIIKVFQSPEKYLNNTFLSTISSLIGVPSTNLNNIIFVLVLFLFFIYLKNLILFGLTYFIKKTYTEQQKKVAKYLYNEYINAPYLFHVNSNSTQIYSTLKSELNEVFGGYIHSMIMLFSEGLMVLGITILLLYLSPIETFFSLLLVSSGAFIVFTFIKKKSSILGKDRQKYTYSYNELVIQSLNGIKDISANNRQNFFATRFSNVCDGFLNSVKSYDVLISIPKLFLESIAITSLFLIFIIGIIKGDSLNSIIPTITIFGGGAFKLLPSINRIIVSLNQLKFHAPTISKVYEETLKLNQFKSSNTLNFDNSNKNYNGQLVIKNLYYSFSPEYPVLENINLEILPGQIIGVAGQSGSGKSTLLNILTGLFSPQKGEVTANKIKIHDDVASWKNHIGFVPQEVFLLDDNLKNNITFGSKFNSQKLKKVINEAKLEELVSQLRDGIHTNLGERGSKISGGQKQRIGIARALYKSPQYLFFDESTSALDNITENQIMDEIYNLAQNRTIIIVAHRLSTLIRCDKIIVLNKGKIVSAGSFNQLQKSCNFFQDLYNSKEMVH